MYGTFIIIIANCSVISNRFYYYLVRDADCIDQYTIRRAMEATSSKVKSDVT